MKSADSVLKAARRPLFSSSLWVPLLLMLAACGGIVYYAHQQAIGLAKSVEASARTTGLATANQISGFLEREHERLQAFSEEKADEIRSILDYPDNWPAIDELQTSVQRMFRGAFAFTVTGRDGKPLFEDFDGLVGDACQVAMRDYIAAHERGETVHELPPIHPVPDAYHFDLISLRQLEDGTTGLFFVSMSPDRIAELIAAAEYTSGLRILLVSREDPTLIEVSAAGARDRLRGDFRLEPEELSAVHFSVDLDSTHWRLVALPDADALAASVQQIYMNTVGLVVGLLLISAALLYLVRRHEQRNSSVFLRSLQSSVSQQRAILQSMVDGMVTTDASGEIRHVNQAVTKLFGYESGELIGANLSLLIPDGAMPGKLHTDAGKILDRGQELMAQRKDGSQFPVLFTLGESISDDEHIFVGILHDLSAFRAAQRQVSVQASVIERSQQDLKEISQIASNDLRPPLQRIASIGAALGAEQFDQLDSQQRAQLNSLAEAARGMGEMAQGLAEFAQVQRVPADQTIDQAVELDSVLRDVQNDLAMLIDETGAQISVQPLGAVLADAAQLHQLFWNLLDNALKFRVSARPPKIRVTLESPPGQAQAEPPAESVTHNRPDSLTVRVDDNGMGIAEDQLDAVFEAFRRLQPAESPPGVGLGLSFCRKIVEGQGGRIWVESRLGEGSSFFITLPRAR